MRKQLIVHSDKDNNKGDKSRKTEMETKYCLDTKIFL